jgi:hypothetical protein
MMTSEISQYLQPEVLERMDREFTMFLRHEAQRVFHRQLLIQRRRLVIGSQHIRQRDCQVHQRWPQGAILFFAKQEVVK